MKEADLRITVRREKKTCQQYRGSKFLQGTKELRKERRNEGTKERRNEGTKERRNEGTKELRNEGTKKERRNEGI